jgi:hypothetical protein
MGGSLGVFRLTAGGFGTGEDPLRRNHEVYVIQFIALGWVHLAYSDGLALAHILLSSVQLRKSYQ